MSALALALAIIASGGIAALLLSRWPRGASLVAVVACIAGGVLGVVAAAGVLRTGTAVAASIPSYLPYAGGRAAIDPLSAFFLVPVFVVSPITAIYGRAYLAPYAGKKAIGFSWFSFNLLVASMAAVVVARHAVLFLVAWEVMSVAAFLLVTFEHEREDVRRAGFVYLVATHVATCALIAFFLLLERRAGSFDFDAMAAAGAPGAGLAALVFVLALVGFGVKAGIVPLHVWLPEAHAAAPSHVSALMSAVLIKMGVYGLLRSLTLFGPPRAYVGPALAIVGLASALTGILLAVYQRDMKRALAYSSVENVGLVFVGLGTALWGATRGMPAVAVLAASGALLHVYNHAVMKGLLFLGAGSVLHGTGSRDLERLGGVLKRMPWTGSAMIAGAVAISALPPLNGFVSKWLLYMALLEGGVAARGHAAVAALFGVGLLALVGALSVLSFVRLVGIALLGAPRSEEAANAHESPRTMVGALAVLAAVCVAIAVAPRVALTAFAPAARELAGDHADVALAKTRVTNIGEIDLLLFALVAVGVLAWALLRRRRPVAAGPTWSCGYVKPTARMQYTARSFSEVMAERIAPRALRPRIAAPSFPESEPFAAKSAFEAESSDPVTRGVYEPLLARAGAWFARFRWVQQGVLHVYVLYVVIAVLGGLAWVSFHGLVTG